MKREFPLYFDGGRQYLELHAMRAPLGPYATWIQDDGDMYDVVVVATIAHFEDDHGVKIFTLGRSGRHICIEDTPANRRRFDRLQAAAIQAAEAMWADMKTEHEPDAIRSEN